MCAYSCVCAHAFVCVCTHVRISQRTIVGALGSSTLYFEIRSPARTWCSLTRLASSELGDLPFFASSDCSDCKPLCM